MMFENFIASHSGMNSLGSHKVQLAINLRTFGASLHGMTTQGIMISYELDKVLGLSPIISSTCLVPSSMDFTLTLSVVV